MIKFNSETGIFTLETPNSTYSIAICKGYVGHAYYGKKIGDDDIKYLTRWNDYYGANTVVNREKLTFMDFFPNEYPTEDVGDFRNAALAVTTEEGHNGIELKYVDYKILEGTDPLNQEVIDYGKNAGGSKEKTNFIIPAVFAEKKDCQTLQIRTRDEVLKIDVILNYTVFNDCDAIVRSSKIINNSDKPVYLKKALSASFDMDNSDFDIITLHGTWARERHINRRPLTPGMQGVSSNRGISSHQEHPFIAIAGKNADESNGDVYGMNFIYSGNFEAYAQVNQFNSVRTRIGINSDTFCWKLLPEETFSTPQAVLVYSSTGFNGMSHAFHDLYREHLIRSPYKKQMRPILINNWEATYFDFDADKLISIAKEAKNRGIEMLVMDDGWFGHRSSDDSSLGDWIVNENKLKGGLNHLVSEVNKIGLKFGIWFEPEMVSPDSDLYREHPDWAIQIPDREPGLARQQLVLDITRKEVRDYVYQSVAKILRSANIEYVKWDMNRPISDIGSKNLTADTMGEFSHRYVLALYEMQNRLITDFPNLLLENCSSGGARFDPGMFFFSPQIWCSDDTDAIERLSIQEGTALMYPLSTIGAHVSVCPNHLIGRNTPLRTRGYVALSGTFGYELDITKLSDEDKNAIPAQISLYKKFSDLVRSGDYWRIASYQKNNEYDCWMSVSKDKKKAIVTFVQVLNHPNMKSIMIKLKGLDENKKYRISYPDEDQKEFPEMILSGSTLMNAGLCMKRPWGDFQSRIVYIEDSSL